MARASLRLRVIPATFRSSATMVSYRSASMVVAWCSASARTLATRACSRPSRAADFLRRADPGRLREWAREARRSRRRAALSGRGPGTVTRFPVSSVPVMRALIPRSIPIAVPGRDVPVFLDGERHVPALRGPAHRRRQDPRGAGRDPPGQLPRGLVRGDHAEPRQLDSVPVAADGAGEPEGVPGPAALLVPGEAELLAFPLAFPGLDEIAQGPVQVPEALLVA